MSFRSKLASVGTAAALTTAANLATSVYLHRALTHRALRVRPAADRGFRSVLWLTTGIDRREWVAVHRRHHAKLDTELDPHSPALLGWRRVLLANVALYRKAAADTEMVERYTRDLPPDHLDRTVFRSGLAGLGVTTVVLGRLLGGRRAAAIMAAHIVAYVAGGGLINGVTHTFGDRPHDNSATNVQLLAWLIAGEGLHNNHHHRPTAANFAFAEGEVDPGWWLIRGLEQVGMAEVRSVPVPA
ncbi:MAG: fatty acid desaturase [Actinomycetota bacterium]